MKRRSLLGGVALVLCLPVMNARPSQAQGPQGMQAPAGQAQGAVCTVRIIQALHDGKEFDPRLEPLRKQLTEPPFSAWKSFRLLQQHDLRLPRDKAQPFALPGEHAGELIYMAQVNGPKHHRVRVHLGLHDGPAKLVDTVVLIDDGGTFLQGGIKHAGGILVLGFTCHLHEGPL